MCALIMRECQLVHNDDYSNVWPSVQVTGVLHWSQKSNAE